MKPSPVSAVVKGMVIPELSGFRYGQQIQERQVFELTFRQPLFGSPFSFGSDDPDNYQHQPITLYFKGAVGKLQPVSGTITRMEFINNPGQQATVIISGTMQRPSGNFSRFILFLVALIVAPLLFMGGLFLYVSRLEATMVKTEGAISAFQERASKGNYSYTLKIAPYNASFHRKYYKPLFNTAHKQINELFRAGDGALNTDNLGQSVTFYAFQHDLAKRNDPKEQVTFFYLGPRPRRFVKFDYDYDVLVYVTGKTWFYLVWLGCLLLEVFCFTGAFFCYRMYALDQQSRNRIIWFTGLALAALLNVVVLLTNL